MERMDWYKFFKDKVVKTVIATTGCKGFNGSLISNIKYEVRIC